jgi:hypothetical protein
MGFLRSNGDEDGRSIAMIKIRLFFPKDNHIFLNEGGK